MAERGPPSLRPHKTSARSTECRPQRSSIAVYRSQAGAFDGESDGKFGARRHKATCFLRRWTLSLPHALRFLLASDPDALTLVLGVVYRTIAQHLIKQAGFTRATGAVGAVTLVQRFGSAGKAG